LQVPRDVEVEVARHHDVAHVGDGGRDLHPGHLPDRLVLVEADAAVDAGQEVRLHQVAVPLQRRLGALRAHQDVVGGAHVVLHHADGVRLAGAHRRGQQGEAGRGHDGAGAERQGARAAPAQLGSDHAQQAGPSDPGAGEGHGR
jgi:hypothetical protein